MVMLIEVLRSWSVLSFGQFEFGVSRIYIHSLNQNTTFHNIFEVYTMWKLKFAVLLRSMHCGSK
jgi:hypothetical protein